jgi:hypothetical protein
MAWPQASSPLFLPPSLPKAYQTQRQQRHAIFSRSYIPPSPSSAKKKKKMQLLWDRKYSNKKDFFGPLKFETARLSTRTAVQYYILTVNGRKRRGRLWSKESKGKEGGFRSAGRQPAAAGSQQQEPARCIHHANATVRCDAMTEPATLLLLLLLLLPAACTRAGPRGKQKGAEASLTTQSQAFFPLIPHPFVSPPPHTTTTLLLARRRRCRRP